MSGLTTRQTWTHDHISRCPCCGSWEVISDVERKLRATEGMPRPTHCTHLDPHLAAKEAR